MRKPKRRNISLIHEAKAMFDVFRCAFICTYMWIVCIRLCLAVCYPGYSKVCPWQDNSGILWGEAVGGSGQRSQWVKRLLGCVSTRPWWGCRRKSSTTRQCSDGHPIQLPEHTANKSAGGMKPFIHLSSDILITEMVSQLAANYLILIKILFPDKL